MYSQKQELEIILLEEGRGQIFQKYSSTEMEGGLMSQECHLSHPVLLKLNSEMANVIKKIM